MQNAAESRLRCERASTWDGLVRTATGDPTMYSMEFVVERGKARCPRCVAVAEYSFIELGPNLLRYEVNCIGCGEIHREKLGSVAHDVALTKVDDWLPAVRQPAVPLRERIDLWIATVRGRVAALSVSARSSWLALRTRENPEAVVEPAA